MLRTLTISLIAAAGITLAAAGNAAAAPSPNGPGQPDAECGAPDAGVSPAGFETTGFANAESHYAGSFGTPSLNGNEHAVSQYDVACFQLTSNGR